MMQAERDRVFKALRMPASADPAAQMIFDQIAAEDLHKLEPVLDDIMDQYFRLGRFAMLLEIAAARYQPSGLPSAADLDAVAEERRIQEETRGEH